ncbi:MFS transporter [uncultured Mailhella sp.]|uniref:MFS transporter n=1 Tax=uncultured Mailhella sp. TaxID=1981031 RepID=UPI00263A1C29|nr:MFS transporter [uncultured Mailhella sp.]
MPEETVSPRRQVVIFALITAACVAGDAMLYVALPLYWAEAGLNSLWEVGILLSANRLARLPLNPLIGWLYSRLSTRSCALFASVLSVAVTAGYAYAQGLAAWLVLRFLWGLCWSLLKLGGLFTVMDVSGPHDRGYLIGLYKGTYQLGSLAGMLGGGILADLMGLRVTALACAGLAVAAIVLSAAAVRRIAPTKRRTPAGERTPLGALLRSPSLLWVLGTCLFVSLLIEGFFASTLSAFLEGHWGSPLSVFGLAVGCATAAGTIQAMRWGWDPCFAPVVGRLSDGRLGRTALFAGACWIAAALFALVTVPMPLVCGLLLLLCVELCCTFLSTLSDALATDLAARSQAVFVITAYTLAVDLGAALGPLGGFALTDLWGMDAAYLFAAALLLFFALRWTFRPPLSRKNAEAE